jgi:SAM-dependent methyltransferase
MTGHDPRTVAWEFRARQRWQAAEQDWRETGGAGRLLSLMPSPCAAALDAGCGSGHLAMLMGRRAALVAGLDLSEDLLSLAMRRDRADSGTIAWVRGSLLSLPFPGASFDFVASTFVLQVVDEERALPELKRVLKRRGRLVLWTPRKWRSGRWGGLKPVELVQLGRCAASMYGLRWGAQYLVRRALHTRGYYNVNTTRCGLDELRGVCNRLLPGWQNKGEAGGPILILWENV